MFDRINTPSGFRLYFSSATCQSTTAVRIAMVFSAGLAWILGTAVAGLGVYLCTISPKTDDILIFVPSFFFPVLAFLATESGARAPF